MNVIGPERVTIATHERHGTLMHLGGFDPVTDYWAREGGCVNVEYVRADLLAGAVEALRWAMLYVPEPEPGDPDPAAHRFAELYTKALAASGGQ